MGTLSSVREDPLSVDIDQNGGSLVVRAVGEIDLASGEMLRKSLLDGFESDASSITLDLTGVSSSIQADYTHCYGQPNVRARTGIFFGSAVDPAPFAERSSYAVWSLSCR
jgi:hypothetical protein